ncbi:MAG: hypothetical protein HY043_00005 [Verrucomicrobia bacterium]|nr:hypothetical protein [Verrucomicrobiota bacterium]
MIKYRSRLFFTVQFLALQAITAFSQGESGWTWRNPLPQGNDLWDVAYGNGRFVAVGTEAALFSTNGLDWEITTTPAKGRVGHVAFGNGVFVGQVNMFGVSRGPSLMVSTNGAQWAAVELDNYYFLVDLAFGNGQFVATGNGVTVTSSDGTTWVVHKSAYGLYNIVFGSGKFVALSGNATYTSSDGIEWVEHKISYPGFTSLAYINGKFLATALTEFIGDFTRVELIESRDGANWSISSPAFPYPGPLKKAYNRVFSLGNPQAVTLDGANWNYLQVSGEGTLGQYTATSFAFGGGLWVAVGFGGAIWTSADAHEWSRISSLLKYSRKI